MDMDLTEFFEQKAKSACFYIEGMLSQQVPFDEVSLFMWDTLEEWWQVNAATTAISEKEKVLWHLFHLLKRWPEQTLRNNPFLRRQLEQGCDFLRSQGPMLLDCAGIRP